MTNITIALPDDRMAKLREIASRLGVTPEDLVRLSVEDLLGGPEEKFDRAAMYVLKKNEDLYRRLA
jgi:predicted transcriptional regulator